MENILILGIGNILMADDGVGVHVINYIKENSTPLPSNIDCIDGGTAGFDLLPFMQENERVIIIDALISEHKPGTIRQIPWNEISVSRSNVSLHQAGTGELVQALSATQNVPVIDILAITVHDVTTVSMSCSPLVCAAIPRAAAMALRLAGVDNYIFDLSATY
ncbi:MAG: hydrogenase maturation protease [Chitinivibrionales bacterium]|nr:hydrogenase maturation protease [Chitinivibrionales bacterium]